MDAYQVVFLLLLVLIVLVNVYVTIVVLRSELYERPQKLLQCTFIWLVPLLGAGLAYAIVRQRPEKGAESYPTESELASDPLVGLTNASSDYFHESHEHS